MTSIEDERPLAGSRSDLRRLARRLAGLGAAVFAVGAMGVLTIAWVALLARGVYWLIG